jgi:hypothetical protein
MAQVNTQPRGPTLDPKTVPSETRATQVSYRSSVQQTSSSKPQSMSLLSSTVTDRSTDSAFAKLRLAASRAVTPPVAPWPSPELSIGDCCSPLGGFKCWEAIGPALAISAGIHKAVKGLLDQHAEFLHEAEPKPCFIAFKVYMIGREERKSNPTLLISCERRSPRQKAVKLVRNSTILRENPGVRLAESPAPLRLMSPISPRPSDNESDKHGLTRLAGQSLYWTPTNAACGIPVYTEMSGEGCGPKATVGGFISLGGEIFGLSAAHGFLEEPPAMPDDEMSFEISFDDWIEGDDIHQTQSNQKVVDFGVESEAPFKRHDLGNPKFIREILSGTETVLNEMDTARLTSPQPSSPPGKNMLEIAKKKLTLSRKGIFQKTLWVYMVIFIRQQ